MTDALINRARSVPGGGLRPDGITAVDPLDEALIAQVNTLVAEAAAVDQPDAPPPCPLDLTGSLRFAWPGTRGEDYVARLDGRPVGLLRLLVPLDTAEPAVRLDQLTVHPDHRRRGIGSALYRHALLRARANSGVRLTAQLVEPLPDGPARGPAPVWFAAAVGLRRATTVPPLLRSRLYEPAPRPPTELPHHPGYAVVHWGSAVPEPHLPDLAVLEAVLRPGADADPEPPLPGAPALARIRAFETMRAVRQRHAWQTAVRHRDTGRVVAWTSLTMTHSVRAAALQGTTVVHPRHRGHGLGLLMKLENLRYALRHEPRLCTVETLNAVGNRPMHRINLALGFQPVDRVVTWETLL